MSTNPFGIPSTYLADQQTMRRERVKITVYTVLGCLVALCLALLFQGCRSHSASAENPLTLQNSSLLNPSPAVVATLETHATVAQTAAKGTQPSSSNASMESTPAVIHAPAVASQPPYQPETDREATPALYVIKKGDSLGAIARAHRTTVEALKSVNSLTSDKILVGKTLKIPAQS